LAVYSFKNLVQQVLAHTDERTDTNIARDLVKDLLNNAHEDRCTQYAENFLLWDTPETFSTVAAQQQYSLHQLFDKPLYFYNRNTKQYLAEVPNRTFANGNFTLDSANAGSARNFVFWGHSPVLAQPTSASVITFVSDSALDTGTDYEVVVKGINTSNELIAEKVALTGLTPVATTNTFTKILAIVKERVLTGTLTATANTGTVTVLRLSGDEFGRQYRQLWLPERPQSPETIEYRFYRKPLYLVNDYDIPDIPAPYSKVLVYDALLQWGSYNSDTRDAALNLWKEQQLKWEKNLQDYCREGQSFGAHAQFVRQSNTHHDYGIDIAR
jgi:hypothetical protein